MSRTRTSTRALPHLSEEDRALLERVKRVVLAVEPTAEIILYGSRARGDAGPESDWDLLILLDGPTDPRRIEAVRDRVYGVEMEEETSPVLSTFVRSREEWESPLWRAMPYHANVEREGAAL